MRTIQTLLVCTFILLSINTISAQYGNNGYGGNGNGRNNQMSQMNQDTHQSSPKPIPTEVTVGKIMEKLKTEIKLDALQEIAISNVLNKSLKAQGVILKQESSEEDKRKDIQALSEITDIKVMEFLDKDQKAKYIALTDENKNKRQSRKQ